MPDLESANEVSRIGCHCWGTNPDSVAALPVFAEVGCRWMRATRPMQMDVVSVGPRKYDFASGGEASIDLAIQNGMSVMGILDGRWGNETLHNDLPYASPIWEHLDLWEHFVEAVVRHYKDRVHVWEVINEPPFFWWYPTAEGEILPAVNPLTRRAPIWAYAELLKASARAIRRTDPQARIVVGSGFSDGFFLKSLYELGCKDSFDIASVHYLNCKHPQDFARGYNRVRAVMAEFGDLDKPLWDTENGPGGAVIGQAVETPAEYEGLYNIYRHCFAHQFGLERYFWFNPVSSSEPGPGHSNGVYEKTGRLSPPYRAMKTLFDRLGNGRLLGNAHPGNEAHIYLFEGVDGPVSVVWCTAPAEATLPAGTFEAVNCFGEPAALCGSFPLSGTPLFIRGDILRSMDVLVTGPRETVVPPMKMPMGDVPTFRVPRVTVAPHSLSPDWDGIPPIAVANDVPVIVQDDHFCRVTTSVRADVQAAYTTESLLLRVRTYDTLLDRARPTGLVQFTLRDSDPTISEWPYFFNSYGLFNLYLSPRGPMFLRYDHIFTDEFPSGPVPEVKVDVRVLEDGLLFWADIPWAELGPFRPGRCSPCLVMFSFNRCDNILDLPDTDSPEEWSHNFGDNFIVKKPALTRWLEFD